MTQAGAPRRSAQPYRLIDKEDTTMRTYDFSPLFRSAIGFDHFARILDDAARSEAAPSYPPYNVELVEENQYRITMAVAGFERSELDIEFERDTLKVTGRRNKEENGRAYLHRGIAERDFEHRFRLADHVKVTGASLANGLLKIELVREIPETLKPRRIEIGDGGGRPALIEAEQAAAPAAAASVAVPAAQAV